MANAGHNPNGLISYGPDTNCTMTHGPDYCPINTSVYEYRPSLAANSIFLALFGIALVVHLAMGVRYRTWAFFFTMYMGCVCELIGYGGRIALWKSVFSFPGFLMQASECWPRAVSSGGKLAAPGAEMESFLTLDSLYHDWSGMVFGSHLPDPVENVSIPHLETTDHASG